MKKRFVMKYRAYELIHHQKFDVSKPHKCPVCGQYEFPQGAIYLVCPICDWMDDWYQEEFPDQGGCANNISLNEYKKRWAEKVRQNEHTAIRKME